MTQKFGRWVKNSAIVASLIQFHQFLKSYQCQNLWKFQIYLFFTRKKYRKQNIINYWPLFGHFRPEFCHRFVRPLTFFTRPLSSYAAKESASGEWEYCAATAEQAIVDQPCTFGRCCRHLVLALNWTLMNLHPHPIRINPINGLIELALHRRINAASWLRSNGVDAFLTNGGGIGKVTVVFHPVCHSGSEAALACHWYVVLEEGRGVDWKERKFWWVT